MVFFFTSILLINIQPVVDLHLSVNLFYMRVSNSIPVQQIFLHERDNAM